MARRAVLRLPVDIIGQLLDLPADLHVLHVTTDPFGLAINLVVTAPDMADSDLPGAHPPTILPTLARVDGRTRIQSLDYPREQRAKEGV